MSARRSVVIALLAGAGAVLSSCGSVDRSPDTAASAREDLAADAVAPAGGSAESMRFTVAPATEAVAVAPAAPAAPSLPAMPTMILRSGTATLRVDSLEVAITALTRAAIASGGVVGNTTLSTDADDVRLATVELRVPSNHFDDALAVLRQVGTVESVSTTAQDVSEEYVDLVARRANAERLEQRLLTVLGTRTGKLEEILSVERELARVREEIERMDGRTRYLKERAAMSTLTVSLHEPSLAVGPRTSPSVLANAFVSAWENFVELLAAVIASSGVWIPVGVVVGGGVLAWRGRRKRGAAAVA
ncbi:MAG: DUF4349 domain-containing protein [Gemmatimonadaceae bacterium]|nr:DUF4349 domain-containing protein [Gemmatimonadaceae bacterium]